MEGNELLGGVVVEGGGGEEKGEEGGRGGGEGGEGRKGREDWDLVILMGCMVSMLELRSWGEDCCKRVSRWIAGCVFGSFSDSISEYHSKSHS